MVLYQIDLHPLHGKDNIEEYLDWEMEGGTTF